MPRRGANRLQPLILLALLLATPFATLPLATHVGAAPPPSSPPSEHGISVVGDEIVVETSTMSITFSIAKNGAIINITNPMTGQYLKMDQGSTNYLWSVDDFDQIISSEHADSFNYSIAQSTNSTDLAMVWQIRGFYLVHALVEARADGYIGMKVNVTNLNPGVEIRRVIFPYIGGIQSMGASTEDNFLTVPEREGYVVQNVTGSILKDPISLQYPGSLSMQYVYWYQENRGGIYMAMQDSQSNYKGLELLAAGPNAYSFDWYQYCANITRGNNYAMDYLAMFKGVVGADWSAGAQVYQDWALKQWYVSAGPVAQRADIPSWVKSLDLVWGTEEYATNQNTDQIYLQGTPSSQMGAFMGQVRSMLPHANLMLYWAGWNQQGFDRGYPDFYPPRDGDQAFKQAISATHALGIKVMLYLNGRLVDDTTPVYNQSLPYLTVDQNGVTDSVTYDNGTLTGGIPAPTTSWWVNEVVNFTVTAVKDYGADGVFLDQNTVASPQLDMSTTHGHLPGGGSWWWQAESNLLETVQSAIHQSNPQAIVSSENVNEVYIRDIALYQSYEWEYDFENLYPLGFAAPLFAYVYHGYSLEYTAYLLPFGVRDYAQGSYLQGVAQSITNGYIPGVFTSLPPSDVWWFTRQSKNVIETVVTARQAFKQFLNYGTSPQHPLFQTTPAFFKGAPVFVRNLTAPAINFGAFQLRDGREALVLANMAGERQTGSGSFPDGLVVDSNQTLLVTETLGNKSTSIFLTKASTPFNVTIPPLSVETLTLEPTPTTSIVSSAPAEGGGNQQPYPILHSSSSQVGGVALYSTSSGPSREALSISVIESSSSGFLHLVLPNKLLRLSDSPGGSPVTLLDGAVADPTVFQNSTVTSVFVAYGNGTHAITISGPASFIATLAQGLPLNEDVFLGVAVLLFGLAALTSFSATRRNDDGLRQ